MAEKLPVVSRGLKRKIVLYLKLKVAGVYCNKFKNQHPAVKGEWGGLNKKGVIIQPDFLAGLLCYDF